MSVYRDGLCAWCEKWRSPYSERTSHLVTKSDICAYLSLCRASACVPPRHPSDTLLGFLNTTVCLIAWCSACSYSCSRRVSTLQVYVSTHWSYTWGKTTLTLDESCAWSSTPHVFNFVFACSLHRAATHSWFTKTVLARFCRNSVTSFISVVISSPPPQNANRRLSLRNNNSNMCCAHDLCSQLVSCLYFL